MYERFVQLLQENNTTAYQVSKNTGVTQNSLSGWKTGKSSPKIDKLQKIADYFNVSIDWLIGKSEYRNVEDAAKDYVLNEPQQISYEIFASLLEKHEKKASDVSKATDLPSSLFSEWKKGKSVPKADKLQKIAEYFNVSLEYLMTGEEKEARDAYYINEETAEIAQQIFEDKNMRMLFDAARDADPEDLEAAHNILLALKRKERGYID